MFALELQPMPLFLLSRVTDRIPYAHARWVGLILGHVV